MHVLLLYIRGHKVTAETSCTDCGPYWSTEHISECQQKHSKIRMRKTDGALWLIARSRVRTRDKENESWVESGLRTSGTEDGSCTLLLAVFLCHTE